MPYKVTIKTGLVDVVVGGNGPFQGGDVVMLTDEQFFKIRPTAFAGLFEGGTVTGISSTATTSPYA